MARRIPIRRKLALALVLPITGLLVVAAIEVVQSARQRDEVREQTDLATASVGPAGLITSLQNERNFAALRMLGFEGAVELPVDSWEEAKQATDDALARFRDDVEDKGGDVVETYGPALATLDDGLADLRETVDTFDREPGVGNTDITDPNFLGYTGIITGLFDANTQVASSIEDPVLRRGVELIDISTRQTDAIALTIRSLLLAGVGATEDGNAVLDKPAEIAEGAEMFGLVQEFREQARLLGTGVYEPLAERLREESDATGFMEIARQTLDEGGEVPLTDILDTVSVDDDTSWYGFRNRVADVVVDRADELDAAAFRTLLWFAVLAGAALAVAAGVTW
ncbi:MAG TPA: nitrate- and nitrite sensing domain-containing protein, partial [Acidimicrobiales bacterium]|nr:nitrate- and nitrite sensing domain-containing protein [Acidimicrobiales bacterium]